MFVRALRSALSICLVACSGTEPGPTADQLLPQHPDAIGRKQGVLPLGAGVSPLGSGAATAAPTSGSTEPGVITKSAIPSVTSAPAKYVVGPGQQYGSLNDVANVLRPGDVVDVLGDATYRGGIHLGQNGEPDKKIVIRGVIRNGKRPVLRGGRDTIHVEANHVVMEGFEITEGTYRCFFQGGHDVTLRDSVVHDCPGHGVLAADEKSGDFTMEFVEVYRAGAEMAGGRYRHPIYVTTDERTFPKSTFRMRFCWVHDGLGGNNVKSRAERNEIFYNWIEGAKSHELEMVGPDGVDGNLAREDSDVVGNVFVKTSDFYATRIGGDGTGETLGRYRFVNNTFITVGDRSVVRAMDGLESLEFSNNVVFRKGGGTTPFISDSEAKWVLGHAQISGSNNFFPKGTSVPSTLTGSIFGEPGFVDLEKLDLHPSATSALKGKGTDRPAPGAKGPFPSPRFPPEFEPVRGISTPRARKAQKPIAIGAFEAP